MSRLSEVRSLLDEAKRSLAFDEGQLQTLQVKRTAFSQKEIEAESVQSVNSKAAAFLSHYSEEKETGVYQLVENLVSQGLTQVFDEALDFKVVPRSTSSRFTIDFLVESKGPNGDLLSTSIMDARGGGLASVAGFLLQVVMLLLTDAPRVLFLDEVFAQVSAEYEARLAEFLSQLVDMVGVQIVLVTHSDAFDEAADACYRTKVGDSTSFVQVK